MAITLTAIPGGAATSRKPLVDISDDVKSAVEDAYLYNTDSPAERLEAAFDTEQEALDFLADARAYAYQRPNGRVTVSGNATKLRNVERPDKDGKPKIQPTSFARFRVAAYETSEDGEAEAE